MASPRSHAPSSGSLPRHCGPWAGRFLTGGAVPCTSDVSRIHACHPLGPPAVMIRKHSPRQVSGPLMRHPHPNALVQIPPLSQFQLPANVSPGGGWGGQMMAKVRGRPRLSLSCPALSQPSPGWRGRLRNEPASDRIFLLILSLSLLKQ